MAKLSLTQVRSTIKRPQIQKRNLAALGLKKINHTVVVNDDPNILGMIRRVKHLIKVENL